ncbi:hypothetical protein GQ457_12G002350 [Hibiscus cannabinus]
MAEGLRTAEQQRHSRTFGIEMQTNELNSAAEKVGNCFLSPNWNNSMDQSNPFESSLSSSDAETVLPGYGDNVMIRKLIGRLENICDSTYISSQSLIKPSNSTPLNSIPKLNLPSMDSQIIENLNLPFSSDPGFVQRAARFSSFCGLNSSLGSQVKFPDSLDESFVSEKIQDSANDRKRKSIHRRKAKETPSMAAAADAKVMLQFSSANYLDFCLSCQILIAPEFQIVAESNAKRSKKDGADEEHNGDGETENDGNRKQNKENSKVAEAPKDYVHVRARRGQATDSHSLAERLCIDLNFFCHFVFFQVRREKISQRMKFLQDLVPGCNKVTGKAVMLDEIINYVQSLQRQVEFLSMKLATVNPGMNMNMEALLSKDMFGSHGSIPHTLCSNDSSAPPFSFGYQQQQGLSMHNAATGNTETRFSVNPLIPTLQKDRGPVDRLINANHQVGSFWEEDDLHSIVQMGLGQNQSQNHQAEGQVTDAMADKGVQELGRFAVEENNKGQQQNVEFSKVVQAAKKVDSGTKYFLRIDGSENGEKKSFNAEAAITDASTDKGVEEVGGFAVDEYNKSQQSKLAFSKVVQATKQTDASGTKYFLKVDASDNGEMKTFNSEVMVKPSGEKQMLTFAAAKH